jgi:hypothetical protein
MFPRRRNPAHSRGIERTAPEDEPALGPSMPVPEVNSSLGCRRAKHNTLPATTGPQQVCRALLLSAEQVSHALEPP